MPARTLLVIDDDRVDRKAVAHALRKLGSACSVTEADTGREGVDLAARTPFDCILLDYRLPDGDGLAFLDELLVHPAVDAPVVILTGEGSELVAVDAMKRGASDYLPKADLEPQCLYRAITSAVERRSLQRQLAEARRLVEHQALYDGLTGLGNRNLFNRDLERSVASAARRGDRFCLILMDLDKFKACNDTYGHQAGDAVLAEVGRRMAGLARSSDFFFRLGGDEFAAILDTTATTDGAVAVARRVKDAVASPIPFEGVGLEIGVSVGWALYPRDGASAAALTAAADRAMYDDKRRGGP